MAPCLEGLRSAPRMPEHQSRTVEGKIKIHRRKKRLHSAQDLEYGELGKEQQWKFPFTKIRVDTRMSTVWMYCL